MSPVPPPVRKHLGQHFLVDPNIVRKIVEVAGPRPEETVLEIGPGRGALTRLLCERAARVVGVEIDRQLCAYLRDTLGDCANLDLQEGDALSWPLESLPSNTVVVGNLPYYASTPILFRLIEFRSRWSRAVIMLQTEVAQRLVARPGSKAYGVLSVLTQYATESRVAFHVSAQCFRPRPDVGSSVVLCTMRPLSLRQEEEQILVRLVRGAFAHRRKRLVNSLRDEGWSGALIEQVLDALSLQADCRAEDLSLDEFVAFARRVTPLVAATEPSPDRPTT